MSDDEQYTVMEFYGQGHSAVREDVQLYLNGFDDIRDVEIEYSVAVEDRGAGHVIHTKALVVVTTDE